MSHLAIRLKSGDDLGKSLQHVAEQNHVQAAALLCVVGSLSAVRIRMAGADSFYEALGEHEIVSVQGTLSESGNHLHISVSDKTGKMVGGHLSSGCTIRTTAEVVVALLDGNTFSREFDEETGFDELVIKTD